MHEAVLAGFFENRLDAAMLARDVAGSRRQVSEIEFVTHVANMEEPFLVTRAMATALCDAVLQGEMPPEALETIGFALITSDAFFWDDGDDEPSETFHDWACPQINYPLTLENIRMFRNRLDRPVLPSNLTAP